MKLRPLHLLGLMLAGCGAAAPADDAVVANHADAADDAAPPPAPVAAQAHTDSPPAGLSFADPGPGIAPGKTASFVPLASLFPPGKVQLRNGQSVDIQAFPATVHAKTIGCTATLIGPRVVLTAAHCIDDKQQPAQPAAATVQFKKGTTPIAMRCTMHPDYAAAAYVPGGLRNSKDWALCELASMPSGVPAETLSLAPVARDTRLLMLGYGCTGVKLNENGRLIGDHNTNPKAVLLAGFDAITWTRLAAPGEGGGVHATTYTDNSTDPSLCPGDSGGGSMTGVTPAALASAATAGGEKRRVAAINSGVAADLWKAFPLHSYFSPLGTAEFRQFLDRWSRRATDAASAQGKPIAAERQVCLDGTELPGHLAPGSSICRA